MGALIQYSLLQVLDLLSTLAFLASGVHEANPIVNAAIDYAQNPAVGLLLVKAAALVLGVYCWHRHRPVLLARANIFFACLVAWNLIALAAA
jgi:hypothetical protein